MFSQGPIRVLFQLPEQHSVLLRLEDTWWTAWDRSWVKRLCLSMESPVAFDSGATDLELSSNVRLAHALLYGVDDPLSKVKAVPAHGSHYSFNASGNRCERTREGGPQSVTLRPPPAGRCYSTVTLLARLRGLSTSLPSAVAVK